MQEPFAPRSRANRFGLGARPPRAWPDRRRPTRMAHRPAQGCSRPWWNGADLRSSESVLDGSRLSSAATGAMTLRPRDAAGATPSAPDTQALLKIPQLFRPIYLQDATARLRHAVSTDRPFVERLTHFWTNHFAVSIDKIAVPRHRRCVRARGDPAERAGQLHRPSARAWSGTRRCCCISTIIFP